MVIKWKRIAIAAVLSLSCAGATFLWQRMSLKKSIGNGNETPIAFIAKLGEDIERRPARRRLWQAVTSGDKLYNGDAIKTGSGSDVRVQFSDSNRYLDLEPDSLIVIQKSNGEIALDLMEGSLVAKGTGAPTENTSDLGIVLKTAKGKIDITKAAVVLTKGKSSDLEVQVLEGSAKLKNSSGESKDLTVGTRGQLGESGIKFNQDKLKILAPKTNAPIYMNPENLTPVTFKWEGFPKDHKVKLSIGKSRREIKEKGSTTNPTEQQIALHLPIGNYYWKIEAIDPKLGKVSAESSVYKLEVLPRFPPTVVYPLAETKILMEEAPPFHVTFKWQIGPSPVSQTVTLQLAKDPLLKQVTAIQTFTEQDHFDLNDLAEGTYYWRVSSRYANDSYVYSGGVNKFMIAKKEVKPPPPVIPVLVHFTNPPDQQVQYYIVKPELNLSWVAEYPPNTEKTLTLPPIAAWRLKIYEEKELPEQAKTHDLSSLKTVLSLTQPGRYLTSIEALDATGKSIGISPVRSFHVASLPLLASPKLNSETGIYNANSEGKTEIVWDKIEGAKEYDFQISDSTGRSKSVKNIDNRIALKSLMPGEYQIKVSTIDTYGRSSVNPAAGKIIVPNKSSLRAPALKSKKVKADDD